MSGANSTDSQASSQKHFTSKRTLAIVYAVLVLAFAAGLILTDGQTKPSPQVPASNTLTTAN